MAIDTELYVKFADPIASGIYLSNGGMLPSRVLSSITVIATIQGLPYGVQSLIL